MASNETPATRGSSRYARWLAMTGIAAALLGSGIWVGQSTKAASGTAPVPGSADDPVVTKSYVDQKIAALGTGSGTGSGGTSTAATFDVVQLSPGQQLIGGAGTEIIVRGGSTTAIAPIPGNGLSDVTAGQDLEQGAAITNDHLLIIARSDGRGIAAQSGTVYVMVLGPRVIH